MELIAKTGKMASVSVFTWITEIMMEDPLAVASEEAEAVEVAMAHVDAEGVAEEVVVAVVASVADVVGTFRLIMSMTREMIKRMAKMMRAWNSLNLKLPSLNLFISRQ